MDLKATELGRIIWVEGMDRKEKILDSGVASYPVSWPQGS